MENHFSSSFSSGPSKYDDRHSKFDADAALAYTIGFVDVMGAGNLLISRNLGNYSLETYTAVAILYWGVALAVSFLSRLLEKSLETKGR